MKSFIENPALQAFVAQIKEELILAQILILRKERGFELKHVSDRLGENVKLRLLSLGEVRAFSQFTSTGAFRPLKSAPNLPTGWRLSVVNEEELEFALDQFYPNAIADWFAIQSPQPPVTHYRDFTNRQSGMYRITTILNDQQAAQMIRACCDKKFCLKRRLWSVEGLSTDLFEEKSLVPCLEPCAILLEFARKAVRLEQQKNMNFDFAPDEVKTIQAALDCLAQHGKPEREADFNSPTNPRHIELLQQKFASLPIQPDSSAQE